MNADVELLTIMLTRIEHNMERIVERMDALEQKINDANNAFVELKAVKLPGIFDKHGRPAMAIHSNLGRKGPPDGK